MAAGLGFKDFVTGEVLTAADVDGYLMQGIWVFANATARDAAVTSPQEGNACYLKDTDVIQTYSGSAWVAVGGGSTFVGAGCFTTSGQTINNATQTAITWNSEEFDTDGFHSTSTNTSRMTIPTGKAGKYLITAQYQQDSGSTAGNQRLISIRKNGSGIRQSDPLIKAYGTYAITAVTDAAVGDYFEIFAYQDSGGSMLLGTGVLTQNFFISYLGA